MTELKQMFKAQTNSMPTTITNNISISDTMITVLDGSILPDAPSLLVIGSGTNAETVKMTEKNIDIITVERGFQGSPKGWNVGTTIARNFTAYDHDAFMDNINDLNLNKVEKDGTKVLSDLNYSQEDKDQIGSNKEDILDLAGVGRVDETVKGIYGIVGKLTNLTTRIKSSIVNALNGLQFDLDEHKADFMSHGIDNAGFHNSIYRGKYLGNIVTATQYANIQNGKFADMYIGDYWTIGGINWRIACFNYYRNTGDSLVPGNHITIVPDTQLYTHHMNPTNITTGGYTGSDMYINGLEQAKTTIRGIFGSHLIKHRQLHSNATVDGKASGWAWVDSEVDLMSEIMVYGSTVWGESTIGGTGYNIGVGKSQLPLFALNPQSINTKQNYWLRDVVSASDFARVSYYGAATCYYASYALGVRPAFSIS